MDLSKAYCQRMPCEFQKLTSDVRSRALAVNIFVIDGVALHPESIFKSKFNEWLRQ